MDRRIFALAAFSLVFLSLLSQFSHAAYTEWVVAQVADQDYRMVEGALAYVEHEINSVAGTGKTKPVPTNASGEALIGFTNYEEIASEASEIYTLYVKYGDQLQANTLLVQNSTRQKPRIVTFFVKSYYFFAKVHDQKGAPLNASVTIGGQMKRTDAQGNAVFQLPSADYVARIEHANNVITKEINMTTSDNRLEVAVGVYNFEVVAFDENRQPLEGVNVEVGSQSAKTLKDGTAQFYNVTVQNPEVFFRYRDSTKKVSVDLEASKRFEVGFDLTKPEVKELQATVSPSGTATVSTFVSDPGSFPSGIDKVFISYEVDGVENGVPAYAVGYNAFEAKVPAQKPGTVVAYTVRAIDKDGNVGFGHGTYSIAAVPEDNSTVEPQVKPEGAGGMPLETAVIGIVVVAIAGFGAFYYLRKRQKEPPPPSAAAQPPKLPI